MTDLEYIRKYQGEGSRSINNALRKRNPTSEILIVERRINDSLTKLKKVPNKTLFRVEHSICSFNDVREWFSNHIGKIICFPSFISCSLNEDWMEKREFKFIIQTIKNTNAHSLIGLNPDNPEFEVLYKSKSSFIINGLNDETKTIFLTEINGQKGKIIYQDEGFFKMTKKDFHQRQSLSDLDLI